jgi:hypothetical protein
MAAPAVLGYGEPAATIDRILGPSCAAVAIIAMSEVTRPFRWVNVLIGSVLIIAAWLLGYPGAAVANSLLCGAAIIGLASRRGAVRRRVGGGWAALWKPSTRSEAG